MNPGPAKPRLLFVHPGLTPSGGREGVAAWLLEGVVRTGKYDVAVVTLHSSDFEGVNRHFGTSLRAGDFEIAIAPPWIQRFIRALPTRSALLEMSLFERFVSRFANGRRVDLFISTCNEHGFPRPGIQYIHYPKHHPVRGAGDHHWYHRIPGLLALYRAACRSLVDIDAIDGNRTLANSRFTAAAFREVRHCPVHVVYPPVPGECPPLVPWARRAKRFICLGRIAQEKQIPKVIDIIRRARDRVPEALAPELHLAGSWNCSRRLRSGIEALLARHANWIRLRLDPSREELDRLLAESRYGIHGMIDEHFGMAVAEIQRAGCITFVPATGGPREIVGEDEPLQIYHSPEEAVEKIATVLADPDLQEKLHRRALDRAPLFSTERFVSECLRHIEEALEAARA